MKLKELVKKLSSATNEELDMQVVAFDVSTGKCFFLGEGRATTSSFGNSNAGWIGLEYSRASENYHITFDSMEL
jgi:hypothetical protein